MEKKEMENQLKEAREAGRMEILVGLVSSMSLLNWDQLDPIKELREFIKYESYPRGYKDKQTWQETKDNVYNAALRIFTPNSKEN